MPDVQFITSNPAIDEFNRANQVAADQQAKDLNLQKAQVDTALTTAAAPTKLRTINAQADLATTNAAKGAAELPYAGPLAAARVNQANASTRASLAAAKNSEMQGFYKSLDLANSGDMEGAKAVAARTGQKIPDEVLNNANLRATITAVAKRAQELYPNRPANQQAYIKAQMDTLQLLVQSGQHPDAVMQPYVMPQGAPQPPDMAAPKGGGEIERIISNLQEEYALKHPGKQLSYADAVSMARRGSRADEASLQRERLASSAARADPAFATDPQTTLEKWRTQYGLPSKIPQGAGTREQPYTATNQDQIDWFKQNAKPGTVLSVPGPDGKPQLFTK
jgi:hypothetical protein